MIRPTLAVSAVYLAAVGLGLMLVPVLNWLSRGAEPSPARKAILIANVAGFGAVAANDIWGVASGEARELARIFLVVHLSFTLAFLLALRTDRLGS